MWVLYQSTITIQIVYRRPHLLIMLTCARHSLCVCMFSIHCETKFWLLCCYYSYTIFGHIEVNTTGMWRTMSSYINWAFQQYPEWDTIGMQTWCKYSIALVVTTLGPGPRIFPWIHSLSPKVASWLWNRSKCAKHAINTCTSCQVIA